MGRFAGGIGQFASNIGPNIERKAESLSDFGSQLVDQPGKTLLGLGEGLGRAAIGLQGTGPGQRDFADPNQQITAQIVDAEVQQLTDVDQITENPVDFLISLAGIAAPATRAPGLVGKIGRAVETLDPAVAVVKGIQKGTPALTRLPQLGAFVTNKVLPKLVGVTTGKGQVPAHELVDVGLGINPATGKAFENPATISRRIGVAQDAIRGKTDIDPAFPQDIIPGTDQSVVNTLPLGRKVATQVRGVNSANAKALNEIAAQGGELDVKGLQDIIFGEVTDKGQFRGGYLNDIGIDLKPSKSGQITLEVPVEVKPKVDKFDFDRQFEEDPGKAIAQQQQATASPTFEIKKQKFELVDRLKVYNKEMMGNINKALVDIVRRGDKKATASAIHGSRMEIGDLIKSVKKGTTQHRLGEISDIVSKKLEEVKGFPEQSDVIKKTRGRFDDPGEGLDKRLGVEISNPKTSFSAIGERLTNVMREGTKNSDQVRALKDLDILYPDLDILPTVAGLNFQGFVPSGLIGKGAMATTVATTNTSAGVAAGILRSTLESMAFIPRFMGQVLIKTGMAEAAAARAAPKMQIFAQKAWFQLAAHGVNPRGMTMAQVLARNEELFNQPEINLDQPAGTAVSDTTQPFRTRSSLLGNIGRATAGSPF